MGLAHLRSLLPDEHPDTDAHISRCADCRGRLETERRYLAALRHAHVPCASQSLQERLLEHTRYLAAQAEMAEQSRGRARGRGAVRAGLSAVAGAAAAAAALAVTAYAVAGEPPQRLPGGNGTAALVRTSNGSPSDQSVFPVSGAAFQAAPRSEEPLDRIGRGLRTVFGASGRP